MQAQSLGDPIIHITFGSGVNAAGPALAPDSGTTTYKYSNGISPEDGLYGIFNTTKGLNPNWILTTDHTGDPNGYMMIVNADYDPGLFYTRQVNGLCGSTTYQFGAYIKNILNGDGILPNVTFSIETPDGVVLDTLSTNNIISKEWIQYKFTFTTGAAAQSVVLKMTNNAPGGGGNDIAIDDITFSPYGTPITVASDQLDNKSFCAGSPQMVTIKTTTPLDHNFAQKLQRYNNGVWSDHSAAITSSSFSFLTSDTAGAYSYRVVKSDAGNINSSQCVVASNKLDVTIYPSAISSFSVADTICQGDTSVFKDRSSVSGSTITSWLWDFGDGQTSSIQNPQHLFRVSGDHTIKLTVATKDGCTTDTLKTIHVIPQINAGFTYTNPDCETRAVTFTDNSTNAEGNITSRQWSFGDGKPDTIVTSSSPFQHTYDTTGTLQVKLTLITDKGCSAVFTKSVEIHPLPKVNFILPEVCLADSYAQFKDSTFVADNTTLTYLWDFGDNNATAADPNTSTEQNPTHKYTEAKQYQVTLTVTSSTGCQQTLVKSFTVNGSVPVANFNVLNAASLCSNRAVYFVNHSSVDFGNITRIIWDYGDAAKKDTDENPYPGKLYDHKYPEINLPIPTHNYHVTMLAFSGQTCAAEKDTIITTLAVPTLSFNAADSVCLNFGPVQFAAQERSTIAGNGVYSGTGVTPAGLFDPVQAGVGTFDIKYIYTANTGCADTIVHRIKVNPIGTVNAGPDVTILAGGTTTLHATASGDNITYLWAPAIGLSSTTIADPVVNLEDDMTYTLTVTNKYGCAVSDQVFVKVLQAPVIPNTFTPNGDGINDTWVIRYLETYVGATVDIFNRNGQKVYTTINYPVNGWDGRYNGQDLPVGVYYYIINPKHGRKAVSGYLTIIR